MTRREHLEVGLAVLLVGTSAALHYGGVTPVLTFLAAAAAIAVLARLVGAATDQLGGRIGSSAAGVAQSALGNLPELFIALFALHAGLVGVVQGALVGSVIANGVLVLGIAFFVGGLRNGTQRFDSPRARMIATLMVLAAAILSMPALAHAFHTPAGPHARTLSFVCAGVLIVVFFVTLPTFLGGGEDDDSGRKARWPLALTTGLLGGAGVAAAFASDWFVAALTPATHAMHMSQDFAGVVIVAIAGNAVENVVGIQLAVEDRMDFAISVIINSALQVALFLTPLLVFVSLAFSTPLTLAFPTLLAIALVLTGGICAVVVYDGESNWQEGAILVGLYVVIASSFWWGT